jgi:hypothetical protein
MRNAWLSVVQTGMHIPKQSTLENAGVEIPSPQVEYRKLRSQVLQLVTSHVEAMRLNTVVVMRG